jgi:hypothetical protein
MFMPNPLTPILMLALAAPPAVAAVHDGVVVAQLTIRQRIIIRVPQPMSRSAASPVPLPPVKLDEKKGPKCVPIAKLAGSGVARKSSVDLLLSDGSMMRAKLGDDCPALDFYAGLYLKPTPDGMLCADRDTIRARSGRACPISSFKKLKRRY